MGHPAVLCPALLLLAAGSAAQPLGVALFLSEYAGGPSADRYLEVFNAGNATAVLDDFGLLGAEGHWESFRGGATLGPGSVYVVANPDAAAGILARANQTDLNLSSGDDALALAYGNETDYHVVDSVGDLSGETESGWDACGVSAATANHTLLRKATVTEGNGGDWNMSAGTNAGDCEWTVLGQVDWTYLGSFPDIIGAESPAPSPPSTTPAPTTTTPPPAPTTPPPTPAPNPVVLPDGVNLYFAAYAEDGTHNRYLNISNAGSIAVKLADFGFPNVANSPTIRGAYEYWNAFPMGVTLDPGRVYIIAHPLADSRILAAANLTNSYLSNGNDGFALVYGNETAYTILDSLGNFDDGPAAGWPVCGVGYATKDHTLVRKRSVGQGNRGDWATSAGTNTDNCEWEVRSADSWMLLLGEAAGAPPDPSSPGPSPSPDAGVPADSPADSPAPSPTVIAPDPWAGPSPGPSPGSPSSPPAPGESIISAPSPSADTPERPASATGVPAPGARGDETDRAAAPAAHLLVAVLVAASML